MYRYETHLHTSPVSACAAASIRQQMEFYKSKGYDGIFITNHFIDGNICHEIRGKSYAERIEFFFSDYEEGKKLEKEIGIKVFYGLETAGAGEFLVYGLDKQWFLDHPEIEGMKKSAQLKLYMDNGALIINAHPFREASYIDHIELFPRHVHGVEVVNASQPSLANSMARLYAEKYELIMFAGSDNHGGKQENLAGVECDEPVESELDFVQKAKNGKLTYFAENCQE